MTKSKNIVIVTGATGTIGSAICRQLVETGYYAVAITRNATRGEELVRTLGEERACFVVADVSRVEEVKDIFIHPVFENATLSGVVTCAGLLTMGSSATFDPIDWEKALAVNTSGTFYVFQQAIQAMTTRQEAGGILVAIGSRWGKGAQEATAYAASKAALRGMVTSLQKELAGTSIRPVLISPGSVASPMSHSVDSTIEQQLLAPEDIAELVAYIFTTPQRVIFNEITIQAYNYDLHDQRA
jgi:NADP-dependent 3-hydroxy acid dehydrogenase YdfG